MITLLIYLVIIVLIVSAVIFLGAIILPIIGIVWVIGALFSYFSTKNLEPTNMICPNCGCRDIRIRSIRTGTTSDTNYSGSAGMTYIGRMGMASSNGRSHRDTNYKFKREGICSGCGFNFDYWTIEDVNLMKGKAQRNLLFSVVFCLLVGVFSFKVFSNKTSNDNKPVNIQEEKTWESTDASIGDFDYYIDGDYIYLKKYEGTKKTVKVPAQFVVEGKTYTVKEFSDAVFCLKKVKSVILPDGLEKIPDNTFNSSGVEYVYLPASLDFSENASCFLGYFHDVECIYYGGTEEQWKSMTEGVNRADIDAKRIECGATIQELLDK